MATPIAPSDAERAALGALGYTEDWLRAGLLGRALLAEQYERLLAGGTKKTARYRAQALAAWRDATGAISDEALDAYLAVAAADPDKKLAASAVADLIHSVDSLRLAEKLSRAATDDGRTIRVLAQVNTSGEDSKSGFTPEQACDEIVRMAELPGLQVDGLMTMAPFVDDKVVLGAAFAGLRTLSERLRAASDRIGPELSMGMTNDLEIAIREGSTMVRIGTALFGERGSAT